MSRERSISFQRLAKSQLLQRRRLLHMRYILEPWTYNIWRDIEKLGAQNSYYPMSIHDLFWSCDKDHIGCSLPRLHGSPQPASPTWKSPSPLVLPLKPPHTPTGFAPITTLLGASANGAASSLVKSRTPNHFSGKKATPRTTAQKKLTPKSSTSPYRQAYKDLLAVPVVPSVRSEKEKLAGGLYTTTLEGLIPTSGHGIQVSISHWLG
ncbi:hypothetical protein BKA70DRAFT_1276857 [Coprinopsis sp. MPI-PUGE-AT-0042]|nr:hypothetical protein BKA70DRAFT_1276857 [Coprinopsis sp. MPI-PUGE-AT-0042]